MKRYLLGLDSGGGGCRALLVDADTGRTSVASRRVSNRILPGTGGWGIELDLDRRFAALGEATREAMQRAGAKPDAVVGIAASGMRFGLVVQDVEGRPLFAAANRDARAAAEGLTLGTEHGETIHRRTGHWPTPIFTLPRLQWLRASAPDLFARAHAALSVSDWLAFRLCGQVATDASQAGGTLLLDLNRRVWASDLAEAHGVPARLLPEVLPSGKPLGKLHKAAATALGLREGIPIGVGAADTQSGLLGLGVTQPNQVGALLGTSSVVQRVLTEPRTDPRLWTGHHPTAGRWVIEANGGLSGDALEWLASALFVDSSHPVADLFAEAAASPPGACGVTSTVGANVMSANKLGLPVGGLSFCHFNAAGDTNRRRHLARAAIEGLAFALRANLELLGASPPELRLGGGLCRSEWWPQLVADVTGLTVRRAEQSDASAMGAAVCAGVAAGLYPDLGAASQALARLGGEITPDPERSEIYAELFGEWKNVLHGRAEADTAASSLALKTLIGSHDDGAGVSVASDARPRILVTAEMDEDGLSALRAIGDVTHANFRKTLRILDGSDLVTALEGVDVFVTEVDVIDAAALKRLPGLKVVASCRGQAVNVDAEACTAAGIPVINAPGRNADAVADLTVAYILMLARKLPRATAFLHEEGEAGDTARMGMAFAELQGRELWRKTVGLVGMGAIGRAVTKRLRPFGVRVVAHDPFQSADAVRRAGAEPVTLEALLEQSDFVSLHAAVGDGSRNLVGKEELARMKRGAFLVNTARAALVHEDSLVEALRSGHLGGAALDVFWVEPPGPDHPLLMMPNVIGSPHVGGNTVEVAAHQGEIVAAELARLYRGEPAHHLLNPDVGPFRPDAAKPAGCQAALDRLATRPGPAITDLEMHAPPPATTSAPAPATNGAAAHTNGARASAGSPKMKSLLEAFGRHATSDAGLREASKDLGVTMHYLLPDVGLELHLVFDKGDVRGEVGPPPKPAPVRLKMRAEVFDQVFTGAIDPAQAAMTGKLSFTGDTRLAMGLQRLKADMTRVYLRAREENGGPGELPAAKPAGAPKTSPSVASVPSAGSVQPVADAGLPPGDLRTDVVSVVKELFGLHLITSTGGNVSARIPGTNHAWITPGQVYKGGLTGKDLVRIDLEGEPVDPDAVAPSSERLFHCAVLRARTDIHAVVHAHAPKATALALAGLPFLPINAEAAFLGEIPRIPFIMPGTQELADAVVAALGKGSAVLMNNHGLLVAAATLRLASDLVEIIERTSELLLDCHAVGKQPPILPPDIVTFLREAGRMVA